MPPRLARPVRGRGASSEHQGAGQSEHLEELVAQDDEGHAEYDVQGFLGNAPEFFAEHQGGTRSQKGNDADGCGHRAGQVVLQGADRAVPRQAARAGGEGVGHGGGEYGRGEHEAPHDRSAQTVVDGKRFEMFHEDAFQNGERDT